MADRIVIALDLDETLICATLSELARPADFYFEDYHIYVRPHLNTFIQKCNEYFDIAVWSSAGETYVISILTKIIPPHVELRFVWTRIVFADARMFSQSTLGATKNVCRLIANNFEPSQVLIVDDNPDDSVIEFGNVLQVQPYRGQSDDCELFLLSQYLEKVRYLKDARNIPRAS